jgi:hypothetical protein
MSANTRGGFIEVGLYACNNCGNVRSIALWTVPKGDASPRELHCPGCKVLQIHRPVCVDFERREFIVPMMEEPGAKLTEPGTRSTRAHLAEDAA